MQEKEQIRLELRALLEGYPSFKQILQNIKQVIWILDLSTDQILYVSPAFELIWGRSCESLYAEPLTLIKSVHPEDRVKVMSASTVDSRKSLTQSYRILRPDGSLRFRSFFEGEQEHCIQVSHPAPESRTPAVTSRSA